MAALAAAHIQHRGAFVDVEYFLENIHFGLGNGVVVDNVTIGAQVIGISNNAGATLFDHADIAIHAPTPPEVIAGSTRLGAGTAQKVVLNMMSTLMGIRLGHVHDGMMVNLVADNEKLRGRAAGMVAQIANVDTDSAKASLEKAGGVVKLAVLLASGADAAIAGQLLDDTKGNLRAALARL
mgnify:CR=1 FL=1